MRTCTLPVLLAGPLAALLAPDLARSQDLVVPAALADQSGVAGNHIPFGPPSYDVQHRYQQAYAAAALTEVAGGRLIALAFRLGPSEHDLSPGPAYRHLTLRLSTGSDLVGALSTDLDANRGADEVLAFEGDLCPRTLGGGAPPNPFDLVIELHTPFAYGGGDLLVEVAYEALASPGLFGLDAAYEDGGATVSRAAETSFWGAFADDVGLVTRFTYEPGLVGVNYCGAANLNSTGGSAVIHGWGWSSVGKDSFSLSADGLPAHRSGVFLVADQPGFVPFVADSQGNLCLAGTIGRFAAQAQSSGESGCMGIVVDLAALPVNGGTAVQPGETWYFQCWFRDAHPMPTSNLSDGLKVTFTS